MKTVKMIFSADQSYNFNPKHFLKGVEYDVPEKEVQRWLKRGGHIVAEAAVAAQPPKPDFEKLVEDDLPDPETDLAIDVGDEF